MEKASNGMPFLLTMRHILPQILTAIHHRLGIDHIVIIVQKGFFMTLKQWGELERWLNKMCA